MASAPASTPTFRTIAELAERCGQFCWVETRLFELTGLWASLDGPAEWKVFCSVTAGGHAAMATEWRARLPFRAGVDQEALVVPPPGPLATTIDELAQGSLEEGLPVVIGAVLPELVAEYSALLDQASPVSEAPVMALLARAAQRHADVVERGRTLLS